MVKRSKPDVGYSDPSHAAFNEKRKLTPTPAPFDGPWIKPETLARLPNLARAFQMSRDPLIAKQARDLEGGEQSDGGVPQSRSDKPRPELKPPLHMREGVGTETNDQGWLVAQRDMAMKTAVQPNASMGGIERTNMPTVPQRHRGPSR